MYIYTNPIYELYFIYLQTSICRVEIHLLYPLINTKYITELY